MDEEFCQAIFGRFTVCLEKCFYIFNPLLKKIISIFFLQNKKDLAFLNREIRRRMSIFLNIFD